MITSILLIVLSILLLHLTIGFELLRRMTNKDVKEDPNGLAYRTIWDVIAQTPWIALAFMAGWPILWYFGIYK